MAAPEFPDAAIRLTIASTPAHLAVVRAALERLGELIGLPDLARGEVVLAVDEALTNIIRHAYHGAPDQPIEVTFQPALNPAGARALEITLRDWGERAEPAKIKARDLDDVRPGGLGVHIMRRCMDKVQYAPAPERGTFLTMVKTL